MRAPDQEDQRLADFWGKLLAGAAQGRLDAAFDALRGLLGAASIGLVRTGGCGPALGPDGVLAFQGPAAPPGLGGVVQPMLATDHGAVALVRNVLGERELLVALRRGAAFTCAELAWLRFALPHLRAGLDLADRLASPLASTESATQLPRILPTPCLLTDDAGRLIESNEAFRKILATLSGSVRTSRVTFGDPALQDAWRRALLEAHATATTRTLLTAAGHSQWKVHIVPFACSTGEPAGAARCLLLAFFERMAAGALLTKTLPSTRPLTKAELEVLGGLLLGRTAKVIARDRGASVNTVRSQITSILGKTEHRTQKELIAAFGSTGFDSIMEGEGFDSE